MKFIDTIKKNVYRKVYFYEKYEKIINNPREYEKITTKKIFEEVIEYYSSNINNVISICTLKELKFLKLLLENDNNLLSSNEYKFEISELESKLILYVDIFNDNICIYEELIETIEKVLDSYDENELEENEKIVIPVLGFLKVVFGIHIDDFPLALINKVGFESTTSFINYLKGNKLFNFYCIYHKKLMISKSRDYSIANTFIKRKKLVKYPFPTNYDLKKYENIFYYDFDIDNPIVKDALNKLKNFFTNTTKEYFIDLVACNFVEHDLIKKYISVIGEYYEKKVLEYKDVLITLSNEMPSAELNGFSTNEYKKLVDLNSEDRHTYNLKSNLSKKDVNSFYKVMYAFIDYTNKRYKVNPKINTNNNNLNNATYEDVLKLLDLLWGNIDLLSFELTKANKYNLNDEELKIAKDFVKSKKNKYIVAKFEEDGTIFADDKYLYKVKGLIEPIQNVIGTEPPIFVDATLLEFKGQIIYDGFIIPYGISIGKNIKSMLNNELKNTKIINSFNEIARSDKKWLK